MIRSMTGFGRAEALREGIKITAEIKSLNHRYQEISVRLPGALSPFEGEIKKKLNERFSRGRIEVTIRMNDENLQDSQGRYQLNLPLIRNYYALLRQLKDELNLPDKITLEMLAGFRDAYVPLDTEDYPASLKEWVNSLLDDAMATLMAMREKEGESLCQDIACRLDLIQQSLLAIDAKSPQMVLEYQRRLTERVKELTGGLDVDEWRLAQEVAIMAEKSDVTEEIVRFQSHISQFRDMLCSSDAVGRKIDFLIQEMNREVNTIGSKCPDAEISRHVIDMKSELSRLREQVQNIE